jgi:hypothetical protein
MREPSLRTSRLAIAGGFFGAVAIGAAGFLLGRAESPAPAPAPGPQAPAATEAAPPPQAPRILDRADFVALGARAADAVASGSPAVGGEFAGRRFELVLPFGCDGPAAEGSTAALRWRYDAPRQTLRIHAAPARWTAEDWGLAQPGSPAPDTAGMALEGFWIDRPWSSAERCPPAAPAGSEPAAAAAAPLPVQTLAVAELRTGTERRDGGRGDRPYEIVARMAPEGIAGARGFHLRLIGRIERLGDGAAVRCVQPAGSGQRPACLVAVSLDEVRIENPADGERLGTWSIRPDEPAR